MSAGSLASSIRCLVRRDTYRDSVELMRVAAELERLPGVSRAALMMATPANRQLLAEAGLLAGDVVSAGPNDLLVAVSAETDERANHALDEAARLLVAQVAVASSTRQKPAPRSVAEALTHLPNANLAIVSTPGTYATAEALKALKRGLNVFLFSDNVAIAEEVELKRLATAKRLLLMGPDCGTAILDGVPLGFANAVARGRVGLAGASGTGLQEVSCLVDRLGEGVSHVIGVGSHDLDERVGGLMMLAAIDRLARDPGTAVIVLVSKPPAPSVAARVLDAACGSGKPVVATFLGGDAAMIRRAGATPAVTLEDAARFAVAFARGEDAPVAGPIDRDLEARARAAIGRFAPGQRHIRGLFSGGTLCQEAALVIGARAESDGHTCIDLGDDAYTVGRPHPMIDFRLRNERIVSAAADPTTAVILLDVVLGYGAHLDPAGALTPALEQARRHAGEAGRALALVASVCGTRSDPQDLAQQEGRLAAAGVILAPGNAQAARLATALARGATTPHTRTRR